VCEQSAKGCYLKARGRGSNPRPFCRRFNSLTIAPRGHAGHNEQETLLPQTNRATRYVSRNLANCRNKLYNKFTTNRGDGEGDRSPSCSKQPQLVDCRIGVINKLDRRRRRPRIADNAIELPRRNFVSPKFRTKFQREVPYLLEIPKFIHSVG